jgi:hypothetical protein
MVYLKALSVTEIIYRRIVEWEVNNELDIMQKEAIMT